MKYSVLFSALLLAACGGTVSKPGVTQEQLALDTSACKYEATKATANGGDGFEYGDVYNQCLAMKGYH